MTTTPNATPYTFKAGDIVRYDGHAYFPGHPHRNRTFRVVNTNGGPSDPDVWVMEQGPNGAWLGTQTIYAIPAGALHLISPSDNVATPGAQEGGTQ